MAFIHSFTDQEYNQLYAYAVAISGCKQQGFDLLHHSIEAWHKVDQTLIQYPMAYLKRMIRNHMIDLIRQKNRHQEILETLVEDQQETFGVFSAEQDLEEMVMNQLTLDKIWTLLSTEEREILYLWGVEGYTAREIGLQLNCPRATVLSKMHRVKIKINKKLSTNGATSADRSISKGFFHE